MPKSHRLSLNADDIDVLRDAVSYAVAADPDFDPSYAEHGQAAEVRRRKAVLLRIEARLQEVSDLLEVHA